VVAAPLPSFEAVLSYSMASSRTTRAWCESCKAYVQLSQQREVTGAPPLLCINAEYGDRRAAQLWTSSGGQATPAGTPTV
ncbi:hypothetical protein, partial [Salmonella enterica]|uniref:hypothetical protein n=1 Tax=Salmonella enterica TaxID=28901 RepID=UPI003D2E9C36